MIQTMIFGKKGSINKKMDGTEYLIQEIINKLMIIKKDYELSKSMNNIGKAKSLTDAVELLYQYMESMK